MAASRRRFTQEFKDELCREVISTSKPIKDVATAYGVGPETLRNWLIKYREANGGIASEWRSRIGIVAADSIWKSRVVLTLIAVWWLTSSGVGFWFLWAGARGIGLIGGVCYTNR